MKRWVLILFAVILLPCLGSNIAQAQANKSDPMAKLTHSLVTLHDRFTTHLAQRSAASFRSADPLVSLVADRVVVDAVAAGDVDLLKADLVSLGMRNAVSFGRVVSGQLPIAALPAAAGLASLGFARSTAAITNAGSVTSQGDQAIRSNVARATYGVDGSGVTVGALSDSFNCLGGAAADITSGDLSPVTRDPGALGAAAPVPTRVGPCCKSSMTSPLALVWPLPLRLMAWLLLRRTFSRSRRPERKYIVDDVIYLAEPLFQDGTHRPGGQ